MIVKEDGMEARYQKLKSALKDIELDEKEVDQIRWLAGWGSETVDNMVSIMNKLANRRVGEQNDTTRDIPSTGKL